MKYNKKTVGLTVTTNYEGAPSYTLSPEFELYAAVVTASLGNKFYESEEQLTERIRSLIKINKPEFVAKLAVYTREKMYLRSVPLALVCELANIHSGNNLLRKMTSRVIQRADEITELLACYLQANNRTGTKKLNKISKQLQKGIADAFNKFNEYQFAKYNRAGEITLKDALFLTHPKAITETQQTLFNKIVEDKLEVPYTWEVELSRLGQTTFINEEEKATAFKEKWEEIIKSNKLGYMALLRNLRNIIKARVNGECQEIVYNKLSDPEEVRKSKQFPFRFYSAYKMIEGELWVDRYTDALEKAIQVSVENVKGFEEDTRVVIACDVSGSMGEKVSPKSIIRNYDIGLVLGMLLQNRCRQTITGIFGSEWKIVKLPKTNILSNISRLDALSNEVGWSTNGYKILKDLINRKIVADKICIFTDLQLWDTSSDYDTQGMKVLWNTYKKEVAPEAKIYLFDLAGYGNTPLSIFQNGVYFIAGWSEKIFEVMDAIDKGSTAIKEIEKIVL